MEPRTNISDAFFRGNYKDILVATVDSDRGTFPKSKAHYVIAALAFLGRIDEALLHFEAHRAAMASTTLVAARFFLGVGFSRLSHYATARRYFTENLLAARSGETSPLSDASLFYVYQGIGFFRFLGSRFPQALRAAKRALHHAIAANYRYGRDMASDLMGHTHVKSGDIAAGLKCLADSAKINAAFGNGGAADAIAIAIATYRAAHGVDDGDVAVAAIRALIATVPEQDGYSRAMLYLELARQLTLRGEWDASQETLATATHQVYASGHKRFSVLLNLRYAYNAFLAGDAAQAFDLLTHAKTELDAFTDLALETQLLGLELRARQQLYPERDHAGLRRRLERLTHRTGAGIAKNILARESGTIFPRKRGLDPLGDVRDLCVKSGGASPAEIIPILTAGYLNFLREPLGIEPGARLLVFDVLLGSLVICDQGNLAFHRGGVSPTMKNFLLQLARGPMTKPELIASIWGYQYHPLRHDPLLYNLVNRLRRILGKWAAWVQASGDGGYHLAPDVHVRVYEHSLPTAEFPDAPPDDARTALNHRQLAILSYLEREPHIDAQMCQQLFKVAKITASRDLTQLFALKLVRRIGRGRATVYRR